MRSRTSASGVPLMFTGFRVESLSALTLPLRAVPRRGVLAFDDDSEFVTEEPCTARHFPNESVYIFAHRAHYPQRGDIQSRQRGQTNPLQKPARNQFKPGETSYFVGQLADVKTEDIIVM